MLLLLTGSCSPQMRQGGAVGGRSYESKGGHINYKGNRLTFNTDSTFVYTGYGPSVYLSRGQWHYDRQNKELVLTSAQTPAKFIHPATVDTFWVDLSSKKVKIRSQKEVIFDSTRYYWVH